jgi:hypothetical protein
MTGVLEEAPSASEVVTAESAAPIASVRAFRLRDSALCTSLFLSENASLLGNAVDKAVSVPAGAWWTSF